jgi:hypothetical protein
MKNHQNRKSDQGGGRSARLASALRANLLRRKRQASARAGEIGGDARDASDGGAQRTLVAPAERPHDSAEIIDEKPADRAS